MSVQRDYILRMIEQVGQFWAALLQRARAGQHREALGLIDRTCRQALGFDGALLESCTADELIGLVRLGHAPRRGPAWLAERLAMLALLLRGEADTRRALGDAARADDRARKAVAAALAALAEDPAAARAAETIDALAPQLRASGAPPDLADALWAHYERAGRFARAEDWLFTLLDAAPAPPDLLARGLAFYARLAARDDRTLDAGDLPRDELAAGLAELQARLAPERTRHG